MKKIVNSISVLILVGSLAGCGAVRAAKHKPGRFVVGAAAGAVDGPGPVLLEFVARDGSRGLDGERLPYYHKAADVMRVLHWGGLAASAILMPPVAIGWAGLSAVIGGTLRAEGGWTNWKPVKAAPRGK